MLISSFWRKVVHLLGLSCALSSVRGISTVPFKDLQKLKGGEESPPYSTLSFFEEGQNFHPKSPLQTESD